MKKILCMIIVMALLCASLCGCGEKVEVKAEGIALSQTQIQLMQGEKHTLYAVVSPSYADDVSVKWESTNEDVATVSRGTITAKESGSAKIYARNAGGEVTAACDVMVADNFLKVGSGYKITDQGYGTQVFGSISEAVAYAGKDCVIVVEEGEYDEYVNITKSVTIKGQNAVIKGAFVIGYPALDSKEEEIKIDGFDFQVGKTTSLDQYAGIYIGNECDDVEITNCSFSGDYDGGEVADWNDEDISIGILSIPSASGSGAKDIEIVDCEFSGLDFGVMFMPYVSSSDIESCSFKDCGFGIMLCGSQKIEIENNVVSNSGFVKFGFSENLADMIEFENNEIESYPDGYLIEACEGCVDKGLVVDLRKNTFLGVEAKDMTIEEFQLLASKISGVVKDGMVVNVKLASNKEMKKFEEYNKVADDTEK